MRAFDGKYYKTDCLLIKTSVYFEENFSNEIDKAKSVWYNQSRKRERGGKMNKLI